MRDVKEEWPVFVALDKANGALGVPGRELSLVGIRLNGFLTFDQWQVGIGARLGFGMAGPHVVRVRQTEVFIEAVPRRQKFRMVAQVPFAKNRGSVPSLFDQF